MTIDALAKATFLYRTTSNVALPSDYWERQSPSMKQPFVDEARAVLAAISGEPDECPCGHDESEHVHYCSHEGRHGSCGCSAEYARQ